jgi:hypothetical protein
MLDGTFTGLQASVADWLNRSDLTAQIPDFVALAEAQIGRRLLKDGPVRRMMCRTDATVAAEFVAVPADFMGSRGLYLGGALTALEFVEPEKIVERKALYPTQDGDPTVYTVVGGEFQFWPWTGLGTYAAELTYWQRIPALATLNNQANWLLTLHPDAYLYGTLLQSAPYLKNDTRLQTWGTILETILGDIVAADKIERMAPHLAMAFRPGGTP